MSTSWYGVNVLLFFENYIWFGGESIRNLTPKERDWSSDLNKWCNHWCAIIKTVGLQVCYLLNFNEVCRTPFLVDTSTKVPCSGKVSTSPSNQKKRKLITRIFKILEIDRSVNDRHDPLLTFNNFVHVSDQKVVPHHLILPRFVFLNRARVASQEKVMWVNIRIVVLIMLIILFRHCELHILISYFAFSHLSHQVFLQWSCQIVGVWEIEPFVNLYLLKIVQISVFVVSMFTRLLAEHGHQLHIFDSINTVSK